MHATRSPSVAGGALLLALCAVTVSAGGARAEEGGALSPPSSLAAFEELYARLTSPSEDGSPPPELAAAAEGLRFDLRADLIRSDAEIEVLKLEAASFTGQRQQEALDRLVDAAAARERRLWLAIRRLERLAGATAIAPVEPPAETAETKGGLQVVFEAEDPAEDPDP